MQKTLKTAFRLQATSEKRGKWGFGASRKVEIRKNNVSGCPDELFLEKMNRRGVPKPQNFKKQAFGGSRSSKNLENKLSGSPEASKFQEISFRGGPKPQNFKKQAFGESRSSGNLKNGSSGYPEKAKCDISKRKVMAEGWKRRVLIEYDCLAYYKNTASTVELSGVSYILR